MQPQGHTVLVTGGATGIGFISGRRQEALDQARKKLTKLVVFRATCPAWRMNG